MHSYLGLIYRFVGTCLCGYKVFEHVTRAKPRASSRDGLVISLAGTCGFSHSSLCDGVESISGLLKLGVCLQAWIAKGAE